MADRYTYVPFIGLFIIIAFGSADLAQVINNKMIRFWILGLLSCVLCLVCVITTSIQLKYWQNSITLLEHTLSVIESDNVAIKTQADALIKNGRLEEAARLLTEKIGSHPVSPLVHGNLGNSFLDARKIDDAIVQYMIALKLNPGLSNARHNLALALAVKGDFDGAIEHYKIYSGPNAGLAELLQKALVVNPDSVVILTRLGYALAQSGRPAQALDYYYKALKLEPNNIFVHGCLVLALADMGKTDEAIEHCRIVLAARPNDVEMHNNLGIFLRAKDKLDEASESFKKAIQIDPNFKPARDNLDALPPKSR
jgi:tetratricopeptide (TPR) repeat protein